MAVVNELVTDVPHCSDTLQVYGIFTSISILYRTR